MAQAQIAASSVLQTIRGRNKLAFNGYLYNQDRTRGATVYWRCEDRTCRGRIIEIEGDFRETSDHNHAPDPCKIEVSEICVKAAIATFFFYMCMSISKIYHLFYCIFLVFFKVIKCSFLRTTMLSALFIIFYFYFLS